MYYKHKDCISVCVTVVKFIKVTGKSYARIKVRWHSIHPNGIMDMNIESWLTTNNTDDSTRERRKYPLKLWDDWNQYKEGDRL